MSSADPRILSLVTSFLERQQLEFEVIPEKYCDKLVVRSGVQVAYVSVFNTGKINVGGKESALRDKLFLLKNAILSGGEIPGQSLPFEIEKFPETIQERVQNCDPVIVRFISEAIICVKVDAILAAAFMLGAASERAINILVQTFGQSIGDEKNRERFFSRINARSILRRFEAFCESYKSCKTQPPDPLSQDLDVVIGSMFQFCRITRNEIGHPQIVPDLDRGVLIANLGHFVTYIERIHGLINFYSENSVVL